MATTTAGPVPTAPTPQVGAGRVVALVAGSLGALVALGLLLAGVVLLLAHATARDADGFYTSDVVRLTTATPALTAEGLHLGDVDGGGGDWAVDTADATVRIRAAADGGAPVFVGIARERDLDRYLAGVAHEQVTDVDGGAVGTQLRSGAREAVPPTHQGFWVASATGPGAQRLEWKADGGDWAAVVMNADGTPGVRAAVSVGAKTAVLLPIGVALLFIGLAVLGGSWALAWLGLRGGPGGGAAAPVPAAAPATAAPGTAEDVVPYPVAVEARLDEPLSRWLWLVKWFLAIPHWIALAFLWAAFAVLTIVALVAIAVTGRYPRAIFDFNVGVMRWSWRVGFYATSAIGTDRYPPFTLGRAHYPAELEVPYPERLSRGKALVKWWLLALPHYAILAALYGGWNAAQVTFPGVVTVLVLVAGVVLALTGRYPREVFRLVVGINRWLYRVIAYAAGMRDEYPPFRLER
jgi:hypothetical protein